MSLSNKDKRDYIDGVYEIFNTLGSTKILYHPLNTETVQDIYGEKKFVQYLDPIELVGISKADKHNPTLFPNVVDKSHLTIFVEIPLKTFELTKLSPYNITTGVFEIEGKIFNILSCQPKGMFADNFSVYEYYCEGVESL